MIMKLVKLAHTLHCECGIYITLSAQAENDLQLSHYFSIAHSITLANCAHFAEGLPHE